MSVFRSLLVVAVTSVLIVGCSSSPDAEHAAAPKPGAQKSGATLATCTGGNVPEGTTNCLLDLDTGQDSYWSDTDGVDPGTAGCHDEYLTATSGGSSRPASRAGRPIFHFVAYGGMWAGRRQLALDAAATALRGRRVHVLASPSARRSGRGRSCGEVEDGTLAPECPGQVGGAGIESRQT